MTRLPPISHALLNRTYRSSARFVPFLFQLIIYTANNQAMLSCMKPVENAAHGTNYQPRCCPYFNSIHFAQDAAHVHKHSTIELERKIKQLYASRMGMHTEHFSAGSTGRYPACATKRLFDFRPDEQTASVKKGTDTHFAEQ